MQVEKQGDSTVLSAIIRLLERAQAEKPRIAALADRAAASFVLILLLIASAVFVAWSSISPSDAFWVTLSVLVVTCPCALSLATPAALTAATGSLTEKGILITRGHALESLAKVTHIVFDKTGTLTQGQLSVAQIELLGSVNREQVSSLAAALEQRSEHPIAHALRKLSPTKLALSDYISLAGQGVQAHYQGSIYRLGTLSYVEELVAKPLSLNRNNVATAATETDLNQAMCSDVYLVSDGEYLARFALYDTLRPEVYDVIQTLKTQSLKISLLSGDSQPMVDYVAKQLQITNAIGGVLPEAKLAYIRQLQQQGEIVAMVGDGVNDAPVLAGANVSLAMGSGSQLAQASADMVILSENLAQLPAAVALSRKMQRIIYQNFSWAIFYNILAIPLAAMGWILPWMAAIGMSLSSLLVVLNALRLRH
jgi:Cu2+-exporting ATPase